MIVLVFYLTWTVQTLSSSNGSMFSHLQIKLSWIIPCLMSWSNVGLLSVLSKIKHLHIWCRLWWRMLSRQHFPLQHCCCSQTFSHIACNPLSGTEDLSTTKQNQKKTQQLWVREGVGQCRILIWISKMNSTHKDPIWFDLRFNLMEDIVTQEMFRHFLWVEQCKHTEIHFPI